MVLLSLEASLLAARCSSTATAIAIAIAIPSHSPPHLCRRRDDAAQLAGGGPTLALPCALSSPASSSGGLCRGRRMTDGPSDSALHLSDTTHSPTHSPTSNHTSALRRGRRFRSQAADRRPWIRAVAAPERSVVVY
jgi:hypothetical protein